VDRQSPTIFVSIPSYNDPELLETVTTLVTTAADPRRLHIAVVDQCPPSHVLHELASLAHTVDYLHLHERHARGPCFARALAAQAYRGEDYYLQLDAHTQSEPGWDRWVEQTMASAPHAKCVFSAYPPAYTRANGIVQLERQIRQSSVVAIVEEGKVFDEGKWVVPFCGRSVHSPSIVPAKHIAAGLVFGPGAMLMHVPIDPALYFYGEEATYAVRLFTHGWDVYHPVDVPFYHLYNNAEQTVRSVPWQEEQDEARRIRWWAYEAESVKRQADLYEGRLHGIYGLGSARTLDEYAAYSGVCYRTRTVLPHAHQLPAGLP
jgi:hypothetical protein